MAKSAGRLVQSNTLRWKFQNFLDYLKKRGEGLTAKDVTPMTSGYHPKIDITPEIWMWYAAYFHSIIGVLKLIVELGRIDIGVEASMLSSHLVLPREGHFQELLHVFTYLKKHMNTEMVLDLSEPDIYMNYFHFHDWSYLIYSSMGEEIREDLSPNIP